MTAREIVAIVGLSLIWSAFFAYVAALLVKIQVAERRVRRMMSDPRVAAMIQYLAEDPSRDAFDVAIKFGVPTDIAQRAVRIARMVSKRESDFLR